jgi:hypothetical protein
MRQIIAKPEKRAILPHGATPGISRAKSFLQSMQINVPINLSEG